MNLIEHIQLYHTHHPLFLDEHQKQLESLHEKVTNLQELLESCSLRGFNDEVHDLERRIADVAIDAEDTIEVYIAGDIHSRSWQELVMHKAHEFRNVHKMDTNILSEELCKVTENMDHLENKMMKIQDKIVFADQRLPDLQPTGSPDSRLDGYNDIVGFEEEFKDIMSKITGRGSNLKTISIIGMGGIGKSTLARSVCDHRSTMNYFDVCGWIIISQKFNVKRRMFDLLKEIGVLDGGCEYDEKEYDFHQLGEKLHKHLSGRRFLIIVDDIWSANDWVKLKLFLPDNRNGSRVILTTRLLNVAKGVGSSDTYSMKFLDENTSWSLLCKKVFLNEPCPPKLLEVGKKIAKNCKGLPLSLSVIGGLLGKLEKTRNCWEKIAGDINVIVTAEDDERYLKIIALSYSHLPIHLKPCFLYMGIFPEDYSMDVGALIDLWIAEGFLKRRGGSKSLEEVAQTYLDDLIERSLIYVNKIGNTGKMEEIRIHDLLRDLALREAQKEKFLHVTTLGDPNFSTIINSERRVGLHGFFSYKKHQVGLPDKQSYIKLDSEWDKALSTATSVRSLIGDGDLNFTVPVSPGLRLVRISKYSQYFKSRQDILHLINSRHLKILDHKIAVELSSVQILWNLQIVTIQRKLKVERPDTTFPIWEMPLLRKLDTFGVTLPDPPLGLMEGKSYLMHTYLREIKFILDFRCSDAVLRKMSNIKEVALMYFRNISENECSHYCLDNLARLCTLQKLEIWNPVKGGLLTRTDHLIKSIGFPQSLRNLELRWCSIEWDHITKEVGALPHLEELSLVGCYTGEEWVLEDEYFLSLKVLKITCCALVRWSAESIHFPCLEHLFIEGMQSLEEIPLDIGDIASLQTIQVNDCSKSIVASAKMILKEQRSFGNEGLRILVNQKHIQEDGGGDEEEEEDAQGGKRKKRSTGFVAFLVPFLVLLGYGYVLLRNNKFGGNGKERQDTEVKQKKNNDRMERQADDSWFLCYDYP